MSQVPQTPSNLEKTNVWTLNDGNPCSTNGISHTKVKQMILSNDPSFVIFDVRSPEIDFPGGNIVNAVNIPYHNSHFLKSLPDTINKYYKYKTIIIHCMFSGQRGPMCCNYYCGAIKDLMNKYQNKSFKFNEKNEWFKYIKNMKITNEIYECLTKQNVYILINGFNNWLSNYYNNNKLIENFDKKYWKQSKDENGNIEFEHNNNY